MKYWWNLYVRKFIDLIKYVKKAMLIHNWQLIFVADRQTSCAYSLLDIYKNLPTEHCYILSCRAPFPRFASFLLSIPTISVGWRPWGEPFQGHYQNKYLLVVAYFSNAPLEGHHPALRALPEVNLWQKIIFLCDISVGYCRKKVGISLFKTPHPLRRRNSSG